MTNQQHDVPLEYYRAKLRELDPFEASERTGFAFDPHGNRFTVGLLGHTVYLSLPSGGLSPADAENCPRALYGFGAQILAVRALLRGALTPARGEFKAYRDLPWGETYDANFQGRCVKRLAYGFGSKIETFAKAAEKLGGKRLSLGDAAYDFTFIGNVVCRLILWEPDEEFPPSAQFLFSGNTSLMFDAEDLAVVGDVIIDALKEVVK